MMVVVRVTRTQIFTVLGEGTKMKITYGRTIIAVLTSLMLSCSLSYAQISGGGGLEVQGVEREASGVLPRPVLMGGDDGTDVQNMAVDTSGNVQVDVVTAASALAVTSTAHQSTTLTSSDDDANGTVAAVDGLTFASIHVAVGASLTGTATVIIEVSSDDATTWIAATYYDLTNANSSVAAITLSSSLDVDFLVDLRGMSDLRVRLDDTNGDVATLAVDSNAMAGPGLQRNELVVYKEDVLAVTGDLGIATLGIINTSAASKAGNGDWTTPTLDTSGAALGTLTHSGNMTAAISIAKKEDDPFANEHPGLGVLVVRDDILAANAGVDSEGDYLYQFVDNFGSTWGALTADDGVRIPADSTAGLKVDLGSDNDVVATAGLLHANSPTTAISTIELVGINEQVDASRWTDEVAIAPTGTGKLVKVCVISSGGAVLTPSIHLTFFGTDPTITLNDAAITAAEAATIRADVSLDSADYQADTTQAHNCQEIEESFDSISHVAFFLKSGQTTINSAGGDDELIQLVTWYRRDS